jgi:hypothetical protein
MAAIVNLNTGKIIGAKKNSFAYFHEKGHILYDNSEMGIRNKFSQEMHFYTAVTFTILAFLVKPLIILSMVAIGFFWYYFIFEERWCNNYAREMLGGKRDGN